MNGFQLRAIALLATLALAGGATDAFAAGRDKGGVPHSENGQGTPPQREAPVPGDGTGRAPTQGGGNSGSPAPPAAKHDGLKAELGKGHVTMKVPPSNREVALDDVASLPSGAVVDATAGSVTLRKPDGQWATLSGGAFQVVQPHSGQVVTEIRLHGGNFAACRRGVPFRRLATPLALASSSGSPVRQLWAEGKGRFRTRGRNGSATVRGTAWLTRDRCDGTLVKVRHGLVDVRDFGRRRTVPVRTGKSYLARAAAASKKHRARSAEQVAEPPVEEGSQPEGEEGKQNLTPEERARRREERQRRLEERARRQEERAREKEERAREKEERARQRELRGQERLQKRQNRRRRGKPKVFKPGALPEARETVGAKLGKGKVTVRLPESGETVPLEQAGSVPVGTLVDATQGEVTITAAGKNGKTDWAAFSGGVFEVVQPRTGALITEIRLRGGDFTTCRPAPAPALGRLVAIASADEPVRKLWARGKGSFRTRGRNGSATVRGTIWMTADSCEGTLVKVKRGLVDVRDFARRRTVPVPAGKKYLARGRR